mmetsp:Transcript_9200/g.25073  ORF Transcript_9200/g.25073 Transcript_9200/m.25073 type:complete len:201 (-) Transcript_9200:1335-1937(-)
MVFTFGLTCKAAPAKLSVPGNSPVEPSATRVTKATLYLRLSPTIMTLDRAGQFCFRSASIGTGAMFSPPAPMISSLYRPVILRKPSTPMVPLSPLWSQPSSSMASRVFFSMSATCSAPHCGLARYPIITCRPRKQISPCSSSVSGLPGVLRFASTFSPLGPARKQASSVPISAGPQERNWFAERVQRVTPAEDSLMPKPM